jgi:hypothetical protein
MMHWLAEERHIVVSQSTISLTLKRNCWTRKALKFMSNNRNEELRYAYLRDISIYAADLDGIIFDGGELGGGVVGVWGTGTGVLDAFIGRIGSGRSGSSNRALAASESRPLGRLVAGTGGELPSAVGSTFWLVRVETRLRDGGDSSQVTVAAALRR